MNPTRRKLIGRVVLWLFLYVTGMAILQTAVGMRYCDCWDRLVIGCCLLAGSTIA